MEHTLTQTETNLQSDNNTLNIHILKRHHLQWYARFSVLIIVYV